MSTESDNREVEAVIYLDLTFEYRPRDNYKDYYEKRVNVSDLETLKKDLKDILSENKDIPKECISVEDIIYLKKPKISLLSSNDMLHLLADYKANGQPVRLGVVWSVADDKEKEKTRVIEEKMESQPGVGNDLDKNCYMIFEKYQDEENLNSQVQGYISEPDCKQAEFGDNMVDVTVFNGIHKDTKKPLHLSEHIDGRVDFTDIESVKKDLAELVSVRSGESAELILITDIYYYPPRRSPEPILNNFDAMKVFDHFKAKQTRMKLGITWSLVNDTKKHDAPSYKIADGKNGFVMSPSLDLTQTIMENRQIDPYIAEKKLEQNAIGIMIYDKLNTFNKPKDKTQYIMATVNMTNLEIFRAGIQYALSQEYRLSPESVSVDKIFQYSVRKSPQLVLEECDVIRGLAAFRSTFQRVKYGIVWSQKPSAVDVDREGRSRIYYADLPSQPQDGVLVKQEPEDRDQGAFQSEFSLQMSPLDLLSNINNLWVKDICCDIDLVCEGGVIVKGHRVILAAGSSYFQMSEHSLEDLSIYNFTDTPADVMQSVFGFLYGNTLNLNKQNIVEILSLAQRLGIDQIIDACENLITPTELSLENITELGAQTQENATELAESPENVTELDETPENATELDETPENATELDESPENATEPDESPENTPKPGEQSQENTMESNEQSLENTTEFDEGSAENITEPNEEIIEKRKRKRAPGNNMPTKRRKTSNFGKEKLLFKYECFVCHDQFTLRRDLKSHMGDIHGHQDQYQCIICQARFKLKKELQRHEMEIHGNRKMVTSRPRKSLSKYDCSVCKAQFQLKKDLRAHTLQNHPEDPDDSKNQFQCETCQEKFKHKRDQRNHELEKHGDRKMRGLSASAFCDICMMSVKGQELVLHKISSHDVGLEFIQDEKCSLCEVSFKYKEELKAHMKNVHNLHIVYCEETDCNETFDVSNAQAIDDHAVENHGKVKMKCQFCEFQSPFYKVLWKHSAKMHRKVMCTICDKQYTSREWKKIFTHMLRAHKIIPENTELKKCQECGFRTYQGNILLNHLRMIHNSTPVSCHICGKTFKNVHSFKGHYEWCGKKERFMCSYCGKKFNQKERLNRHEQLEHEGGSLNYQCEQCPYANDYYPHFENHMFHKHQVVPEGKSVISCEICGYQTVDQKYLTTHHVKKVHDKKRDKVKCVECGVSLWSTSLRSHMKIHEHPVLKPFHCFYPDCSYSGRFQRNLGQHLLSSHLLLGEKPYQCTHCAYRSGIYGNVTKHIEVQHCGMERLVHQLWEPPNQNDVILYMTSHKEHDVRSFEEFMADALERRENQQSTSVT